MYRFFFIHWLQLCFIILQLYYTILYLTLFHVNNQDQFDSITICHPSKNSITVTHKNDTPTKTNIRGMPQTTAKDGRKHKQQGPQQKLQTKRTNKNESPKEDRKTEQFDFRQYYWRDTTLIHPTDKLHCCWWTSHAVLVWGVPSLILDTSFSRN